MARSRPWSCRSSPRRRPCSGSSGGSWTRIAGPGSGRARRRRAWRSRASSRRSSSRRSCRVVWWLASWRRGEEARAPHHLAGGVANARLRDGHAAHQPRRHRVCPHSPQHDPGTSPQSRKMAGHNGGQRGRAAVRNAAAAGLGRLRDPDAPPGIRRCQLPLGRAADEGLVVLLLRGAGGQGAARLLALWSVARLALGPVHRSGTIRTKITYRPASSGVRPLSDDHGGRLVAQLRDALPAPAGTAGHRLGFRPGREPRHRVWPRVAIAARVSPASRWRSPESTLTS